MEFVDPQTFNQIIDGIVHEIDIKLRFLPDCEEWNQRSLRANSFVIRAKDYYGALYNKKSADIVRKALGEE